MTQVFISYSRKDLAFVEGLAADLKVGDLHAWYDLSGLEGGQQWRKEIEKAIRASQYVIIVVSLNSIASEWVELEFLFAKKHKKKIIPLIYKHCDDLPMYYLNIHFVDIQGKNYYRNYKDILRALDIKRVDREIAEKKVLARSIRQVLVTVIAKKVTRDKKKLEDDEVAARKINAKIDSWIENVHKRINENYRDQVQDLIVRGKGLKPEIGEAKWLDLHLDVLEVLDSHQEKIIFDYFKENLELADDVPWLKNFFQSYFDKLEKEEVDNWVEDICNNLDENFQDKLPELVVKGRKLKSFINKNQKLSLYLELLEVLSKNNEKEHIIFLRENSALFEEIPWLGKYYQFILSKVRLKLLIDFYSSLRKGEWEIAKKICDDEVLKHWQSAYLELLDNIQQQNDFDEVYLEKNDNRKYAPEDTRYDEIKGVIDFVNIWLQTLKEKGVVEAKNFLEHSQPENNWNLIENVVKAQEELDRTQILISYIKQSYWSSALKQIVGTQKYELLDHAIRNFSRAQFIWLKKRDSDSPLNDIEKIIAHYESGLSYYRQWIQRSVERQKSPNEKIQMALTDWGEIENKISQTIALGLMISRENKKWQNPRKRGYISRDIEAAKKYLEKLQEFEENIIDKPFHTQDWIKTYISVVKQRISTSKLLETHPLYFWLSKFPKKNWIKKLVIVGKIGLIFSIVLIGILTGSKINSLSSNQPNISTSEAQLSSSEENRLTPTKTSTSVPTYRLTSTSAITYPTLKPPALPTLDYWFISLLPSKTEIPEMFDSLPPMELWSIHIVCVGDCTGKDFMVYKSSTYLNLESAEWEYERTTSGFFAATPGFWYKVELKEIPSGVFVSPAKIFCCNGD